MSWRRALLAWVMIAMAESIHGALRQVLLVPAIGDLPSRQVGVAVGCVIIFAIAWWTLRWIDARTLQQQLAIGSVWVLLIVAFEIGLGLAVGYQWERILQDYDLRAGGYMGFGLLFLWLAPALAARARGLVPQAGTDG